MSDDTVSANGNKKRCRKKSSSINQTLSVAVVNSLWSILTGEKINHGDKRVINIEINIYKKMDINQQYETDISFSCFRY